MALIAGGVDTGWTFYTPYSSTYANTHVIPMAPASSSPASRSILTGLNFIVTIHKMRAPGLTWFRLPLFVWSHLCHQLILVLATPVLAITLRSWSARAHLRRRHLRSALGGDPVLFQHLFWFYSHPAVYIMILPGMGVVSELITCFSRKQIFGYRFVAFASMAIARPRLSRLGPSHVCQRPVDLRRHGLFVPQLPGGDSFRDQGLQLDGDAVQGLDLVRDADALCARLHRPVHDWRADRTVPGRARGRYPRAPTPISWSRTFTTSWWAAW